MVLFFPNDVECRLKAATPKNTPGLWWDLIGSCFLKQGSISFRGIISLNRANSKGLQSGALVAADLAIDMETSS